MDSEDWSVRLSRNARIFTFVTKQRGIKFAEVFPEMKGIFDEART